MIDFYHLASEKEDPEIVIRAASHIRHLHTANPTGRVFPLDWTEFDYAPVLRQPAQDRLRQADQRRSLDDRLPGPGAAQHRAAAARVPRVTAGAPIPTDMLPTPFVALTFACLLAASPGFAQGRAGQPAPPIGPRPFVGPPDRPPVDPAAADRGRTLYASECVTCHGPSARGTDNAPSLIRSLVVLNDRLGTLLGPFLKKGHPMQSGKPSAGLTDAQVRRADALPAAAHQRHAARLRRLRRREHRHRRSQGRRGLLQRRGQVHGVPLADRRPGRASRPAFRRRSTCSSGCSFRAAAAAARGGRAAGPSRTAITVTVTPASGAALSGTLLEEDDFHVTLRDAGGAVRVVRKAAGHEGRRRSTRCGRTTSCSTASPTRTSTTSSPTWRP